MPFGQLFGTLFFLLALFAALTSSISILEIVAAWGDEHKGWSRKRTAVTAGFVIWLIGLANVLSFNAWADFHPLGAFEAFQGMTIFDLLDYLTANLMLPLGGVLIAVFTGWFLSKRISLDELGLSDGAVFGAWRNFLRYVASLSVAAVLVTLTLGQIFPNLF